MYDNFDNSVEIIGGRIMYSKSTEKREFILEGAKNVILRKGFSATSMSDITEECKISRGGLYFYFSSVEEIFVEILKTRKRTGAEMVQRMIAENETFSDLLDDYFDYQKERLLHIERCMLSAMMQFGLSHKTEEDVQLIEDQYESTWEMICRILEFGKSRGEFHRDTAQMARHILFLIEGLSVKAMAVGVSPEILGEQFALLKSELVAKKEA